MNKSQHITMMIPMWHWKVGNLLISNKKNITLIIYRKVNNFLLLDFHLILTWFNAFVIINVKLHVIRIFGVRVFMSLRNRDIVKFSSNKTNCVLIFNTFSRRIFCIIFLLFNVLFCFRVLWLDEAQSNG